MKDKPVAAVKSCRHTKPKAMYQEIDITNNIRKTYGDDVVVFIKKELSEDSDYIVVGDCVKQVATAIHENVGKLAELFSSQLEFPADNLDQVANDCIKAGYRCCFV